SWADCMMGGDADAPQPARGPLLGPDARCPPYPLPDVPDAPAARPVPDVPDGGTPMNSTAAPAPSEPREHLEQLVLPFWLEHGIDTEAGGFFTCFDNRGAQRVSTDKFTW